MQKENTERLLLVKCCTGRPGLRCGKCSVFCTAQCCHVKFVKCGIEPAAVWVYSQPGKSGSWGVCLSWCHLSFTRAVSWLLLCVILSDHCICSAVNTILPDPEIWPHGDFWTESQNAGKVPGAQVQHSLCGSLSLQALIISPHLSCRPPSDTGGLAHWWFWQLSVRKMSWVFLSNLIGFYIQVSLLWHSYSETGICVWMLPESGCNSQMYKENAYSSPLRQW